MGATTQDRPSAADVETMSPEEKARYQDELKAAREARAAEDDPAAAAAGDQPEGPGQGQGERPDGQLVIGGIGLADLTKFVNGGKKATHGTLSVRGVTGLELPQGKGLPKGSFIRLEIVAQVDDAGDKDKVDRKQGVVVDTIRRHAAFMVDCRLHGVVDSARLESSDAAADLRRAVDALREQGVSDEGIAALGSLKSGS